MILRILENELKVEDDNDTCKNPRKEATDIADNSALNHHITTKVYNQSFYKVKTVVIY